MKQITDSAVCDIKLILKAFYFASKEIIHESCTAKTVYLFLCPCGATENYKSISRLLHLLLRRRSLRHELL